MGSFQASMLEAFQSLRDELTSKKQVEVDQTLTSKPGTSQAVVNLDLPRINTMMNPINLRCHLLNPKNMLTRVSIR